ncbi:helix-turn-helix domain-containing protein [Corynebacterium testudinoris]|uniref:Putative transcriptional regulator n=1 Tax=Corynebacterium testudinoris TaxID=136857 RepID=A0A0G3H9K7_9CORY|nr:helix-turn-helix transcriptional regulator [Corynebacterium testudinoris]AKK07807.1 putative transcriptional regulator [Corynebacterium testudinoris]MBX8995912.1 helix-turn-helix domain-containing protein [Corynebacterium testudinoris]
MTGKSVPRKKIGKPAGDDPELIALGAVLAEKRRASGRLQQEVAKSAGVSRSTLHTIEHGGAGVRWEIVSAVAHALGLRLTFVDNGAVNGQPTSN